MRGLKQDRSARVVIAGHALVQNVRRAHYELAVEAPVTRRVAVAFNQILAEGCHQYGANCRWDGGATYNYTFRASQVSVLDFFHPDLDGQAALARVTWAASWWPTI